MTGRTPTLRKLSLLALAGCLASGCSMHASFSAGASSGHASQPREPRSRAQHSSGNEHASRVSSSDLSERDQAVQAQPDAREAEREQTYARREEPAGEAHGAPGAHARVGDHDRGHGNDADGVDEDNPGKSKGKAETKQPEGKRIAAKAGDHDRGHGNDADRVDEDNPGKGRKK